MKLKSYKELIVWQKALKLVEEVYHATTGYPSSELYGLTQQTRRSVVSIPSNIAEGWARNHRKEFVQFLYIGIGSSAELETQLEIARHLQFLPDEEHKKLQEELVGIQKMLYTLVSKLRV